MHPDCRGYCNSTHDTRMQVCRLNKLSLTDFEAESLEKMCSGLELRVQERHADMLTLTAMHLDVVTTHRPIAGSQDVWQVWHFT